jgi:hypothetical protein
MLSSITQYFAWKDIRKQVEAFVKSCDECQRHKIVGKRAYGKIPFNQAMRNKLPFEKVQIDCAGPWSIKVKDTENNKLIEYKLHVVTMVDSCTNWLELVLELWCCRDSTHILVCMRYLRILTESFTNGEMPLAERSMNCTNHVD